MPVAIRIVISERGMPHDSNVCRIGGRINLFGTGRVMSEITTHAEARFFDRAASGAEWIGD